jgi:hypothetical protein
LILTHENPSKTFTCWVFYMFEDEADYEETPCDYVHSQDSSRIRVGYFHDVKSWPAKHTSTPTRQHRRMLWQIAVINRQVGEIDMCIHCYQADMQSFVTLILTCSSSSPLCLCSETGMEGISSLPASPKALTVSAGGGTLTSR